MRSIRTSAALATVFTAATVTGLAAAPANAAETCSITGAPTTVVVGLEKNEFDLSPTTNCPEGSSVEFTYRAEWPAGVPSAVQSPGYFVTTFLNGHPKAWHSDGDYPFDIVPAAGNVLAGQTMPAGYTAFVDADKDDFKDAAETTFTHDTTLTVLRATRITEFTQNDEGFSATVQRADWETRSWRNIEAWSLFDLQFRADGTNEWTTVRERVGGYGPWGPTSSEPGDYRVKYRGDVVSGVSYSEPLHVG
ncbi:hypothetical protein LWF15_07465 [Kineosporia rhizophila]|uniref:hypothetical protein n=1 Tax=Kineosporia TaxID=49184 RepID=UPI001E5728D3|nr:MULTISPECIES: hypothetical protein [Kineosporia]MCE0535344.1 hypothetical protein [Kineosporia rhizophila]GLY16876.1 hypothetical protein Kisp01_38910 [Kineosporia sp. NBRC 101677]